MSGVQLLISWVSGWVALIAMDTLWLGKIMSGQYQKHIGLHLAITDGKMSPNIPAALLTWGVIVTAILVFVSPKITESSQPLLTGFLWGGVVGFFLYAVYDLTNLGVFREWPIFISIVDILWGTCVCAVCGLLIGFVSTKFR